MAAAPREGTCAVGSLLSGALSWLVVVTIGLAPMLVYWLARMIGRALRRKAPFGGARRQRLSREGTRATNSRKLGDRHAGPLPRSKLGDPSPVLASVTTGQPSAAQYDTRGATRRSRHGQSVHLGTMVNHRLRRIAQPPVRAVNGWRYWPVHASQAVPSGEHISQIMRRRCSTASVGRPGRLADRLGARSPTPWHLCGLLSIGGVPGRKARCDHCLVALWSDQKWMIKRAPPHGSVCRNETPPRSKGKPL
jgi:hypothetical protein